MAEFSLIISSNHDASQELPKPSLLLARPRCKPGTCTTKSDDFEPCMVSNNGYFLTRGFRHDYQIGFNGCKIIVRILLAAHSATKVAAIPPYSAVHSLFEHTPVSRLVSRSTRRTTAFSAELPDSEGKHRHD